MGDLKNRKRVIGFGIIFFLGGLAFYFNQDERLPFDKLTWQSSAQCKPVHMASKRNKMRDEAIEDYVKNKSSVEILESLGKGDRLDRYEGQNKIIYCMGRAYGLSMYWLVIEMDGQGFFKKHKVVTAD